MIPFKLLNLGLMLTLVAGTAEARLARSWTYAELSTKADLIVIADRSRSPRPVRKRPDISQHGGKMMAGRAATELKIVTLHHDVLPIAQAMASGPGLITFDPTTGSS